MNHLSDQVTGINIAYIGGGSQAWAWDLMADLALEPALSGEVRLYDLRLEAAQANERIGNAIPDPDHKWRYRATRTLEEALHGADFVVISILPGTLDEMESDVHAPEAYGIYQAVGDTVGPGGIVRALRTLPMYGAIAEAIREHCPNAWVISYTNPMTLCVGYLYRAFPGIKAFGCCHEVFGTQRILAHCVSEALGIDAPERRQIKTNVLGINHFTWIDRADYQGIDLMPLYASYAKKYKDTGVLVGARPDSAKYFVCDNRVKFDLFLRYGLIAAAGDRHLAEFCPPWYLKSPEVARGWGFELTPVNYRREWYAQRAQKAQALLSGETSFPMNPSGEEGVAQIKALVGRGDLHTNVNLPNHGQIAGLPIGAILESNALFTHGNLQPSFAGALPAPVNALVSRHVENQQMILDATQQRDLSLAFNAFCNDPLMTLSMADARALWKTMLKNTKPYLAHWFTAGDAGGASGFSAR